MGRALDLAGKKFNSLLVLNLSEKQIDGNRRWDCLCDCGGTTWVVGSRIVNGMTKSCGCMAAQYSANNRGIILHGMSRSSEYRAWQDAKLRCLKTDHKQFSFYGGRGITMQESWIDSFSNFFKYIGLKPTPEHSLDRIDNDSDYCEGNVRWATKLEQVANRGMNVTNKTGVCGVHLVCNPKNGFYHYKACWGPKDDIHNRSFSVNKYGEDLAYKLAVDARLSGLAELKINSVYADKHGEKRKCK